MQVPAAAQAEMNAIFAERKIMTALTGEIPPSAKRIYEMGEEVLVYSENENKSVSPVIVVDTTGRMIIFQTFDGIRRQTFNSF